MTIDLPLPPSDTEALLLGMPGGNTGDHLIADGCERFLNDEGVHPWRPGGSFERSVLDRDPSALDFLSGFGGEIYFTGGGNIGIYFSSDALREATIETATNARSFLVLPQSCRAPQPILADPRVVVWARDERSHHILASAGIATDLVPDAAFAMADRFPQVPLGSGRYDIRRAPGTCQERIEHEIDIGPNSSDLTFETPLPAVIDTLAPYRLAVSDRLHGGLIGLLLGKRVALLGVGYHKIESFHATWLKGDPASAFVRTQQELDDFAAGTGGSVTDWADLFYSHAHEAFRRFRNGMGGR